MATQRRFKADINDGEVTLALAPGQEIHHGWHEPTDEGYMGGSVTFEADREGIQRTLFTYGKDCDGRVSSVHTDFCPWDELKAYDGRRKPLGYADVVEDGVTYREMQYAPDPGWPNWQEYTPARYYDNKVTGFDQFDASVRHYDEFAEAMNY